MELTEVFLTFVISSGIGLILAVLKMCYKSKCSSVELGCFKIVRNTDVEEREDGLEMEMKHNKTENKNNDDNI
jgi:hypothetical protein